MHEGAIDNTTITLTEPFKVENIIQLDNTVNNDDSHQNRRRNFKQDYIIDLIDEKINRKEFFYSMEVSPVANLKLNFNTFSILPLFTAITWSADLNFRHSQLPAIHLSKLIKQSTPVLSHITCHQLQDKILDNILQDNVKNVLALRGDIVTSEQSFNHAIYLLRSIKQKRPDISIAVGGYPELHPESESLEEDLRHLKEKVDAGADFIVTQTCFSARAVIEFINNCRKVNITVPIVPGMYVPHTFRSLVAMCQVCKVRVPENEFKQYKMLKDDPDEFRAFALNSATSMIREILNNPIESVFGVHFFTLNNLMQVKQIINKLNFK